MPLPQELHISARDSLRASMKTYSEDKAATQGKHKQIKLRSL